jgi:hypothetical protein
VGSLAARQPLQPCFAKLALYGFAAGRQQAIWREVFAARRKMQDGDQFLVE